MYCDSYIMRQVLNIMFWGFKYCNVLRYAYINFPTVFTLEIAHKSIGYNYCFVFSRKMFVEAYDTDLCNSDGKFG